MNAVNLAEISISYIRNSHTQEGRQYKFESFEPIIRDDSLLGVVTYGKMRQKSGKEFKTLNFFIPMTAEKPNDMMLMLDSWVPVSAPEELFEDVKNILLSVKFTQ